MNLIYSGNIKSLTSLFERDSKNRRFSFFPTNEIQNATIENNRIEINGMFCKGIGHIEDQNNSLKIDLKVIIKRQFIFIELFTLVLMSGFIWGENVTINGDSNPSLWIRIGFTAFMIIGTIVIPGIILNRLKTKFSAKLKTLVK